MSRTKPSPLKRLSDLETLVIVELPGNRHGWLLNTEGEDNAQALALVGEIANPKLYISTKGAIVCRDEELIAAILKESSFEMKVEDYPKDKANAQRWALQNACHYRMQPRWLRDKIKAHYR